MAPEPLAEPSDEDLLERSRAGEAAAFRQLVERFHGRLHATVLGMLGPGPDTEEVVQDTFLRFYRALHRFEGRASLATYLTRIAMNEALKVIQKRQRWNQRFLSRDDPERTPREPSLGPDLDRFDEAERAARIRAAVQTLKPDFRSVVVLRFLNGCSTDECARILDIPRGTVMSRLSRALDKLGPLLKPLRDHAQA
jgi:RNA polymerase sigma-70 factor, ECF subfamily